MSHYVMSCHLLYFKTLGNGCAQFWSPPLLSHTPLLYHGFQHWNNPPKNLNQMLTHITLSSLLLWPNKEHNNMTLKKPLPTTWRLSSQPQKLHRKRMSKCPHLPCKKEYNALHRQMTIQHKNTHKMVKSIVDAPYITNVQMTQTLNYSYGRNLGNYWGGGFKLMWHTCGIRLIDILDSNAISWLLWELLYSNMCLDEYMHWTHVCFSYLITLWIGRICGTHQGGSAIYSLPLC